MVEGVLYLPVESAALGFCLHSISIMRDSNIGAIA
jgi:hypothetical protein